MQGAEKMTGKQRIETHRLTRIVPPIWLALSMLLMYVLHGTVPLLYVLPEAFRPVGQALVFVGLTVIFITVVQFRRAQTPVKPFVPVKAMITDGMFRYSRNPIYLGMFVMLAGWAVYLGSLTPWAVVVLFVWAIRRFWVLPEEVMMERAMGDTYLHYKQEVRRWL